jgi:putative hemolysin
MHLHGWDQHSARPLRRTLALRGEMRVVLSTVPEDVLAAQKIRYLVFFEEMHARGDADTLATRRDRDDFDAFCDHILLYEGHHSEGPVATYRVLRQDAAQAVGGFYSQQEFDLEPLFANHPGLKFFELGRACILPPYRTGSVVELLWQGIWNYLRLNRTDVMFGCVSFPGRIPALHAAQLSFLAHNFTAPDQWKVRALERRFVPMDRLAPDSYDPKLAARSLPALLKAYLRLGCHIGEGAVIDDQFNSIDVFVVLPVASINRRYFARFGAPDEVPQLLMS